MNPRSFGTIPALLIIAAFIQIFTPIVIATVPFGFDHPSAAGFDFGQLIDFAGLWLIATFLGIALALATKRWRWAGTHLVLGLLGVMVALIGLFLKERQALNKPKYDAAAYQHLIGRSKSEVEAVFGRGAEDSIAEDTEGRESVFYRGIEVIYSRQGRVIAVQPDPDDLDE